jgi:hypothetical protein
VQGQLCCWQTPRCHRTLLARSTGKATNGWATINALQFLESEDQYFDHTRDRSIGRFVLLYVPNPTATLEHFRKLLKPNGIIAFHEGDIEQLSQVPRSELFTRLRSWVIAGFKVTGAELNMGTKLLSAFLDAGLPRPMMTAAQLVESGPDSRIYPMLAGIVRSLLPILEREGIVTAAEVAIDTLADRLRHEATANECVTFSARFVGAWARHPG